MSYDSSRSGVVLYKVFPGGPGTPQNSEDLTNPLVASWLHESEGTSLYTTLLSSPLSSVGEIVVECPKGKLLLGTPLFDWEK